MNETEKTPYNITMTVIDDCGFPKYLIGEGKSSKNNHHRRYNAKCEYIAKFDKWLAAEPKRYRIFAWRVWKNMRPVYKEE